MIWRCELVRSESLEAGSDLFNLCYDICVEQIDSQLLNIKKQIFLDFSESSEGSRHKKILELLVTRLTRYCAPIENINKRIEDQERIVRTVLAALTYPSAKITEETLTPEEIRTVEALMKYAKSRVEGKEIPSEKDPLLTSAKFLLEKVVDARAQKMLES